jgi:hypothetical protein
MAKVNDKQPGEQGYNEEDNEGFEYEEYRNEEEEVQWEDIDVKELETHNVKFQALPVAGSLPRKESVSEDDDGEVLKKLEKTTKVVDIPKVSIEGFSQFSDFKDLNLNVRHEIIKRENNVVEVKEEKVTIKTMGENSLFNNDIIDFFSQNQINTEKHIVKVPEKKEVVKTQNIIVQNQELEIKKEVPRIPEQVNRPISHYTNMPPNMMNPYPQYYQNQPKQNERPNQNFPPKEDFDPTSFLENPSTIIQKNLVQRGWFLMSENNKILGNFNSLDLLIWLDEEFEAESDMSKVWITDYETDIYFTPSNLYEALKDTVPKLIENIKSKKHGMGPPRQDSLPMNKMPFTPNMMPMNPKMMKNMPIGMNNRMPPMGMMPMPMMRNPNDDRINRPMMNNPMLNPMMNPMMNNSNKSMSSQNMPPVNMNINLQFVKNDINLNNIMYQKEPPKTQTKKPSNLTNLFNSVGQEEKNKTKK